MKVYDEQGTLLAESLESFELDELYGYVRQEERIVTSHPAIEYQPELRDERAEAAIILAEYKDAKGTVYGQDIEYPVIQEEVCAQEAWDETEEIYRYVAYTAEEIVANRINELKAFLTETDYIVLKIAEGDAMEFEYLDVLEARVVARTEVSDYEGENKAKALKEKALKIKGEED